MFLLVDLMFVALVDKVSIDMYMLIYVEVWDRQVVESTRGEVMKSNN